MEKKVLSEAQLRAKEKYRTSAKGKAAQEAARLRYEAKKRLKGQKVRRFTMFDAEWKQVVEFIEGLRSK